MFSVAIATVLFPTLSRYASTARETGDFTGFRSTVGSGLRQIAFLLVPAAVVSAVLAEPIVRVLYQRGHFLPNQTPIVASCLAAFSAGLVFNGAMLMLNRAFFSLRSNWIPTWIALGNLFLNAVLDFALYRSECGGSPRDGDLQHRRNVGVARGAAPQRPPCRGRRDRVDDDPGRGCLGSRRRRLLVCLAPARLGAWTVVRHRSSRSASP